ncbi:hypothetical protein EAI_01745 [Harpegnathos saltator]|uniref:Uncharacterized protein n=1 Tax=Harpegnathos saltator TaxID=610380 RepID=E2BQE4_HARSA|nr:hypothetical protein EAI_01745 [Harpegnathos saltator]
MELVAMEGVARVDHFAAPFEIELEWEHRMRNRLEEMESVGAKVWETLRSIGNLVDTLAEARTVPNLRKEPVDGDMNRTMQGNYLLDAELDATGLKLPDMEIGGKECGCCCHSVGRRKGITSAEVGVQAYPALISVATNTTSDECMGIGIGSGREIVGMRKELEVECLSADIKGSSGCRERYRDQLAGKGERKDNENCEDDRVAQKGGTGIVEEEKKKKKPADLGHEMEMVSGDCRSDNAVSGLSRGRKRRRIEKKKKEKEEKFRMDESVASYSSTGPDRANHRVLTGLEAAGLGFMEAGSLDKGFGRRRRRRTWIDVRDRVFCPVCHGSGRSAVCDDGRDRDCLPASRMRVNSGREWNESAPPAPPALAPVAGLRRWVETPVGAPHGNRIYREREERRKPGDMSSEWEIVRRKRRVGKGEKRKEGNREEKDEEGERPARGIGAGRAWGRDDPRFGARSPLGGPLQRPLSPCTRAYIILYG